MKPMFSLMRASLLGFSRDRAGVAWTLLFPIALLALFSALFSGKAGAINYSVGWVDEAHSSASSHLKTTLDGLGTFRLAESNLEASRAAMKVGQTKAIIEIPSGYGQDTSIRLRLLVDPSDQASTGAIAALVDRAVTAAANPSGQPQPSVDLVPIQEQPLNPASYFVPAILAMALMQLGVYGAVTLVQQRERQILKRFASAPIERWSIIGGFVGSRLAVALIQAVLMVLAGRFLAGSSFSGNPVVIAMLVVLTAATFIAIGFALAGLARTEESATQIAGLVSLPLMFLSGLFIPVDQLPDVVRPIAAALPLTHATDVFRQVMVNGTPFAPIGVSVAVLVVWLVGSLAVAVRAFRWQ